MRKYNYPYTITIVSIYSMYMVERRSRIESGSRKTMRILDTAYQTKCKTEVEKNRNSVLDQINFKIFKIRVLLLSGVVYYSDGVLPAPQLRECVRGGSLRSHTATPAQHQGGPVHSVHLLYKCTVQFTVYTVQLQYCLVTIVQVYSSQCRTSNYCTSILFTVQNQ